MALVLVRVVRVVGFQFQTSKILNGLVRVFGQTSVAAAVKDVAVNQLLLGQRDQLSVLDTVHALDVARDGEGPTRAARALIFDRSDGVVVPPVVLFGQLDVGDLGLVQIRRSVAHQWFQPRASFLELFLGQIGELGVAVFGRPHLV